MLYIYATNETYFIGEPLYWWLFDFSAGILFNIHLLHFFHCPFCIEILCTNIFAAMVLVLSSCRPNNDEKSGCGYIATFSF